MSAQLLLRHRLAVLDYLTTKGWSSDIFTLSDDELYKKYSQHLERYPDIFFNNATQFFNNATQPANPPPVPGMTNLGGTCYFNSSMKCLYTIRPLTEFLLKHKDQIREKFIPQRQIEEWNRVFRIQNHTNHQRVNISDQEKQQTISKLATVINYINVLEKIHDQQEILTSEQIQPDIAPICMLVYEKNIFDSTIQEDASEFAPRILEFIRMAWDDYASNPINQLMLCQENEEFRGSENNCQTYKNIKSSDDLNPGDIYIKLKINYLNPEYQPTIKILQKTYITPDGQEIPWESEESEYPFIPLTQLLTDYFSKEEITDYECTSSGDPDFGKRVVITKMTTLASLPDYLLLTINRISLIQEQDDDGRLRVTEGGRIENPILYPLNNLDIQPYLSQEYQNTDQKSTKYDLVAVCYHSGVLTATPTGEFDQRGNSVISISSGGHYTAKTKYQDKWYDHNDTSVTEITDLSQIKDENGRVAIFLIYRRTDAPSSLPQTPPTSLPIT